MRYLYIPASFGKTFLCFVFVLFATFSASSQVDTLKWINEQAYPLHSDATMGNSDLHFLKNELKGKSIVALGEASHGTHEFYTEKSRIISYLIENCGFRSVAFEIPDSVMMQINSFVHGEQVDLKKIMKGLGLYGTEEIYGLFVKLRDHNRNSSPEKQVTLKGFDKPEYWSDPISRDGFMAENVIKMVSDKDNKIILWAHNVHVLKDTTAKYMSMGGYLKKHFDDRYFALAMDTYQGSVNVMDSAREFEAHTFQTNEHTLSGWLSKARSDRFYLKFDATQNPFKDTISFITNIYSNWQELKPIPIHPGIDIDAIIFIKNTTPSTKLK
ncbi:hypothetical protein PBAL39_12810 [Pedobacter sp. BAL39]|uniref:erythromycin esterase family protein n=1 Tax=Pedobacter sp. BAL39 TaxID=391596 RepID=UPI0001559236|nr:hypothetical protein PBAL39_12810 [Pedobacter sp. BAL39]